MKAWRKKGAWKRKKEKFYRFEHVSPVIEASVTDALLIAAAIIGAKIVKLMEEMEKEHGPAK